MKKKKEKGKFPFVNCTNNELLYMESLYFLIMGGDFIPNEDKIYMFTKKELVKLYNTTFYNIMKIWNDEDPKQREFAKYLMGSLRILPVRIH